VSGCLPIVVLSDSLEVGEGATPAIVWRIRGEISELFCVVWCTTVVHNYVQFELRVVQLLAF